MGSLDGDQGATEINANVCEAMSSAARWCAEKERNAAFVAEVNRCLWRYL